MSSGRSGKNLRCLCPEVTRTYIIPERAIHRAKRGVMMSDARKQTETPKVGTIVTFYSYKGGTGRTMALANVAWILASAGKRVLAADWDLESPGLHRFFAPFL